MPTKEEIAAQAARDKQLEEVDYALNLAASGATARFFDGSVRICIRPIDPLRPSILHGFAISIEPKPKGG